MTTRRELEDLFRSERNRFSRWFPDVADARLRIVERRCPTNSECKDRDLAFAEMLPSGPCVSMVARVLDLPFQNVLGLIRHELGHIADGERDRAGREQRADDLAEYVTGQKIYYDQYDVQTVAPTNGRRKNQYPRPKRLHR